MEFEESKYKWIAVTAGFLPKNFEEAAERVKRDIVGLYPFTRILNFTSHDLEGCAPQTLEKYAGFLCESTPGYGFYSWKPEIIKRTLDGEFGECDGVVWLDGGCEVFNSPWTRKIFKNQIQEAEKSGYLIFELNTPEYQYTKSDVFELFPSLDRNDRSPQVQATHFFLFGEQGREIARVWLEAGLTDIHMFDLTNSKKEDPGGFIVHKSDQSILSLTVKSMGLRQRIAPPPAGNRGLLSKLLAMRAPIWVSRNRNGKSLKNSLIYFVEGLTKSNFKQNLSIKKQENGY